MIVSRLALLVALVVVPASGIGGRPLAPANDRVDQEYTRAHQMIDVGRGHKLNLHCMGNGDITVVFDSGLGDWSSAWALVQPSVGARTRACSYDRRGLGYSQLPASPAAIARDLRQLLRAWGKTKLVVVGQDLGGFNMKLFAQTEPQQVVGLVLVDPTEERAWVRIGEEMERRFGKFLIKELQAFEQAGIAATERLFTECLQSAESGQLTLGSPNVEQCTGENARSSLGATLTADRRQQKLSPSYQRSRLSELEHSLHHAYGANNPNVVDIFSRPHLFGDKPLIVLSTPVADGPHALREIRSYSKQTLHAQTAALSRRGRHIIVAGANSRIPEEQPQAVVDAVFAVLDILNLDRATDAQARTQP